jgi:TRAP-type mannitol/chloroaromatic compound transport system substrate-binding protein
MQRREFLRSGAIGGLGAMAAGSFAAPAIAQDRQRWKMVTSWPKNLPGPGTAANELARRITALSGGRLEVEVYGAGEIVPGDGVFDAVGGGTAELYHSVPAYWGSKSVGIELFGSQPFGNTAPEQSGWMNHGGGQALYDEMYARFGLKPFLCGNSGPQWFGWFRKEIESVDDLKGLRFRTTGLNSKVMSKLGVAVQAMGGSQAFQAMQSGAIDAAEFIGPWTDSSIGFHQLTDLYYWPGIGEPSSAEECGVNLEKYEALPDDLKEAVAVACQSLYDQVLTEYNTKHARALIQLEQEHGTQVKRVPDSVLEALGDAAGEVIGELREHDDELVRRITESFLAYRNQISAYMVHADGGVMNARALDYAWPKA